MRPDQALDIRSLHDAYAAGIAPADAVAEAYRRIAAADDPGIFLHLVPRERALAEAVRLPDFDPVAFPLWGVPFAIKDNIDAVGLPTTAACPAFAYVAEEDAAVVTALRAAGAILVGKTNLDQFAAGLTGLRTPFPVPRNACDPDLVPGGSSSGSAVAVARGLVGVALGTDTAGSGRVPAALNGIVGLKPTLGALSNRGVVPACRSLDAVSVFAASVEDAYTVFRAAAAFDPLDPYSRPIAAPPLAAAPVSFRLAVPDAASREFFGDNVQADSFEAALNLLAGLGGDIVEIDFAPLYAVAEMLYGGAWLVERHAVIADLLRDNPDAVHPITRRVIEPAARLTGTDVFHDFYRLQALKRQAEPLLADADMLCVPSVPTLYSVAEVTADPIELNARLGTYTNFVNLMDLCGIAVPTPPRADGRPGSVTLLAPAGRDAHVSAVAGALHRAAVSSAGTAGRQLPAAPEYPAAAGPEEIPIAAVGAHMSGLPLNHELTRLGGRFLKATRTAPSYRLYSLPGGSPARPGLVRDGSGAIDVEIWAIPAARFGALMRGIPSPLGIGTVSLEDGAEVHGFLCESSGTQGAVDITRFGGWRAYLTHLASTSERIKESDHA